MEGLTREALLEKIQDMEYRLAESNQLIEAIRAGEVDAFAINSDNRSEIYTLQSGDYAYRVLIEAFGEGAINVTEEGLIVYTNRCFADMLNLPYEQVIGSLVFDLIHKDSKEKFRHLFDEALTGKSRGEVKLADGSEATNVYVSLTSLQPKLATVGIIVADLTERKKHEQVVSQYQKDLEAKNQELARNNEELASFAYIASHDLQEPLRKIQTFSNLILAKESDGLSPKTKDYFQRIISASKRMQNLIKALLEYSRIDTSKISFITTDLNSVLATVTGDLQELIEEHHARIEVAKLPTLKVVPHQISQLFSNMIINAVKYRKQDIDPRIKIDAQLVSPNPKKHIDPASPEKYWKIAISDNGIGFDQEYAGKIFELFQRLHGMSAYEGAGIGLAICKKIVLNHRGFIEAEGQPGAGATFNIYLPHN